MAGAGERHPRDYSHSYVINLLACVPVVTSSISGESPVIWAGTGAPTWGCEMCRQRMTEIVFEEPWGAFP